MRQLWGFLFGALFLLTLAAPKALAQCDNATIKVIDNYTSDVNTYYAYASDPNQNQYVLCNAASGNWCTGSVAAGSYNLYGVADDGQRGQNSVNATCGGYYEWTFFVRSGSQPRVRVLRSHFYILPHLLVAQTERGE